MHASAACARFLLRVRGSRGRRARGAQRRRRWSPRSPQGGAGTTAGATTGLGRETKNAASEAAAAAEMVRAHAVEQVSRPWARRATSKVRRRVFERIFVLGAGAERAAGRARRAPRAAAHGRSLSLGSGRGPCRSRVPARRRPQNPQTEPLEGAREPRRRVRLGLLVEPRQHGRAHLDRYAALRRRLQLLDVDRVADHLGDRVRVRGGGAEAGVDLARGRDTPGPSIRRPPRRTCRRRCGPCRPRASRCCRPPGRSTGRSAACRPRSGARARPGPNSSRPSSCRRTSRP